MSKYSSSGENYDVSLFFNVTNLLYFLVNVVSFYVLDISSWIAFIICWFLLTSLLMTLIVIERVHSISKQSITDILSYLPLYLQEKKVIDLIYFTFVPDFYMLLLGITIYSVFKC